MKTQERDKSATTLEDVYIGMLMNGTDRGALVRPEQDGAQVGVCVLLMSQVAVNLLGVALRPIVNELGDEPVEKDGKMFDGRPEENVTVHTRIARVFEHGDASPRNWLIFEMPFGRVSVIGIIFVGEICRRVAEVCNRHGAPCSLDPSKPAPGYEVVERRQG